MARELIKWSRYYGYEVSSKGDSRFSAFNAILEDGRTIEQTYQCCTKGYDPGGTNWRLGKGKPPLDKSVDLLKEYIKLWEGWAAKHPELMEELRTHANDCVFTLRDRFASTPVNQANALAFLLNKHDYSIKTELCVRSSDRVASDAIGRSGDTPDAQPADFL